MRTQVLTVLRFRAFRVWGLWGLGPLALGVYGFQVSGSGSRARGGTVKRLVAVNRSAES